MALRILVADDDAWILRMVSSILEKRGYEVETAADGQEAFDRAVANVPDLLITDVMMPKMDGWSLVRALRARPEFNFVPVIFLTALASDEDRIRGFRLGADDYLPKPFRFEELDLRVSKTVRRRAAVEQEARALIEGKGAADAGDSGAEADATPSASADSAASGPTVAKADASPAPHTALTGNLHQIGLSVLLTLLEMERKTGVLYISDDSAQRNAQITLSGGRVVCADMKSDGSDLRDEECIYHLLEWHRGRFEFVLQDFDGEVRMIASATQLLMEGAKRIDESAEEQRRHAEEAAAAPSE